MANMKKQLENNNTKPAEDIKETVVKYPIDGVVNCYSNIRKESSMDSEINKTIDTNEVVVVEGKENGFYKIKEGWIREDLVDLKIDK